MLLCMMLFIILVVYRKRISDKKIWYMMFLCNLTAACLFALSWLKEGELSQLDRSAYGEGVKTETYLVSVEGELEEEEITLEIQELKYTAQEIQEVFSDVMDELDTLILGKNETKDCVTKNLWLPAQLEVYPVQIRWEMDRYDIIGSDGKLIEENLTEEGSLVEVRAFLTYQEYEAIYVTNVNVFAEVKAGKEKWISDIQKSFQQAEAETREEESIALPQNVSGKQVTWRKKPNQKGYVFLGLGIVLSGLLGFQKKQDMKEAERKRRRQMELDYPELISSFAVLLNTGMTVKNTWNKIAQTYEEEKKSGKYRFAYEEMCLTSREMQGGVPEKDAYERFGKRCKQNSYARFSMLLSQNLRKGSKGLSELLKMETLQALDLRKQHAKKQGEEVSTKLLLPMSLMFVVVLAIIMIPAFLSMKI